MASSPPPATNLSVHALAVDARAPFGIRYPALGADAALCIGLSIDAHVHERLQEAALQATVAAEHARAARYLHRDDALRHLLGRALLRSVAAHYGGAARFGPITVNPWGKPIPAGSAGCNLSHAGNQVWVAVAHHAAVGVDVEAIAGQTGLAEMAASFHPDEAAMLNAAGHAPHAVLRCWSRKEAVAKAVGMGLSLALDAFAVDCGPAPAGWLRRAPPGTELARWTTVDLPAGPGYVGALAVDGPCSGVTVLHLSPV